MDNIILDSNLEQVKIVDFGLSNEWHPGWHLETHCGSPEYAAPELFDIHSGYGAEVDLWSLGVVLFAMVTGSLPFTHPKMGFLSPQERRNYLLVQVNKGYQPKHSTALGHMTPEFRHMVRRLLTPSVVTRITIDELMSHPWVTTRQTKMMSNYSYRKLKPDEHLQILEELKNILKLDTDSLRESINSNRLGEIGGMFNMLAHRKFLEHHQLTQMATTGAKPSAYFLNRLNSAAKPRPRPATTATRQAHTTTLPLFTQRVNFSATVFQKPVSVPKLSETLTKLPEPTINPVIIKKYSGYSRNAVKSIYPEHSSRGLPTNLQSRYQVQKDRNEGTVLRSNLTSGASRAPEKTLPYVRCKTACPTIIKYSESLQSNQPVIRVRPTSPRLLKTFKSSKTLPEQIIEKKQIIPNKAENVPRKSERLFPNPSISCKNEMKNHIESICESKVTQSPYPKMSVYNQKPKASYHSSFADGFVKPLAKKCNEENRLPYDKQNLKQSYLVNSKRPTMSMQKKSNQECANVFNHPDRQTSLAPQREKTKLVRSDRKTSEFDEAFVKTIDYEKQLELMSNWEKELVSANKRLSEIQREIKCQKEEGYRKVSGHDKSRVPSGDASSNKLSKDPFYYKQESGDKMNDSSNNSCFSRLRDTYCKTGTDPKQGKTKPVTPSASDGPRNATLRRHGGYGDQVLAAAYPH